ncbi:TetR family transcriptional regulator [Pseudonocardia ailaonensis]|uniref:TetR family transcriptional regulator n=1 Tax=Pseudonocardia ailaonensis TaxID=367279 RepID=A0ABN2N060_9PSEU
MVLAPSTSRGVATRRRILDAAVGEFAEHGIAGARVERIVQRARTNKAQLYGYFGSKDGLFDEVFAESVQQLTEVVPFDAGDLAGWAVGLYDDYLVRPEMVRLATWARLERRPAGHLVDDPDHQDAPKLAALAAAQGAGLVRAGEPAALLSMVIAMSLAWSPVSPMYAAYPEEPESEHARRRELLRDCVRAAVAP